MKKMQRFFPLRPWLRIGLLVVIVIILGSSRGSRAEVEIPIAESSTFLPADLNGIYGYYRADRFGSNGNPDATGGYDPYEVYEAWAVGKNLNAPPDLEKGLVYRFNGSNWKRQVWSGRCQNNGNICTTSPCPASGGTCLPVANESLNSVTGQHDPGGGYAFLWMAGDNGRMLLNGNFYSEGDYPEEIPNGLESSNLQKNNSCAGDADNGPTTTTKNFYAMSAAPVGYQTGALAGGQDGMLYNHSNYPGGTICNGGTNIGKKCTTHANCPGVSNGCRSGADFWQRQCPAGFPVTGSGLTEQITGITYAPNNVRYVVTTTAPTGADLTTIRNCTGSQTGRLYRYDNSATGVMTLLATVGPAADACFFGVTAQTTTTVSANNNRLLNVVWIAAANGVYKYTETSTSTGNLSSVLPGTNTTKRYYAIASVATSSGSGINLLRNGNFESWSVANPNTSTVTPDGWNSIEGIGKNNGTTSPVDQAGFVTTGSCGQNTRDTLISSTRTEGSYSIKVEPGINYVENPPTNDVCSTDTNPKNDYTAAVWQDIPLTNFDATKVRITGRYRVEFTNPQGTPGNPVPKFPEGGIGVGCAGGFFGTARYSPDCSFAYRGGIRTVGQGNTNGFETFSVVISNQNSQYNPRLPGINGNPKVSPGGMILEVTCEATYGARVWCDDLKVEPFEEVTTPGFTRTSVTAVGQDGSVVRNDDAISATTAFTTETNPAAGKHLYGVSYAQSGYLYAVGTDNTLLQRSPSNFNGYLWLGSSAPSSTGRAGLGWISTSCVNDRDSKDRTFCQHNPVGYGLNLEALGAVTTLNGRAWFGKSFAPSATADLDKEQLDLGKCVNPDTSRVIPGRPYYVNNACDLSQRTCRGNPLKACARDFDCYGRCEKDAGFICLYNSNCQIGATPADLTNNTTGSNLVTAPYYRIQCDASGSAANACVGGGWLSFNPTDWAGVTPPAALGSFGGGKNYCGAGRAACLESPSLPGGVACVNGEYCRLIGIGRFLTAASPADPNAASDRGWVSLRGPFTAPNAVTINSKIYGGAPAANRPRLYACKSCISNPNTPPGTDPNDLLCGFCQDNSRQTCFHDPGAGSQCYYYCDGNPTQDTCVSDATCASTYGPNSVCRQPGRCSLNGNQACQSDAVCQSDNAPTDGRPDGYCAFGALCAPYAGGGAVTSCEQYGVNYDPFTQTFNGYGWSSDYGWMDFRFTRKGTTRFIQTSLGDIYSQQRIGDISTQRPPGNMCNATYVISAGQSIYNFCSSFSTTATNYETVKAGVTPIIPFSSQQNAFGNALGRFDLTGIETPAKTSVTPNLNKYGSPMYTLDTRDVTIGSGTYKNITSDPTLGAHDLTYYTTPSQPLNNGVYIATAPKTCTSPAPAGQICTVDANCLAWPGSTCGGQTFLLNRKLSFYNGSSSGGVGNGILIVNGSLRVNSDMIYDPGASATISDPRFLGSLFVVVRGDLIIDTNVRNMVGGYYVTGTICTVPRGSYTGTGLGSSCNEPAGANPVGSVANKYPLQVRGLMMANKFIFGRRFAGTADDLRPSELIIFDGRIQANPMPGMTDFAGVLPIDVGTGQ